MAITRMCDLPQKLIGEKILTRIPITSLREVRSTCKSWDALTKTWILGNEAPATKQFLGFMTKDSKVCSVRFHKKEDLVDLSIEQVDLLNQVEVSQIFHCDGLMLCVAKDKSKLVVWNPYLCQTRSIAPRTKFHVFDRYALGYDKNRNHKILRFRENCFSLKTCTPCTPRPEKYEIYNLSSNSWRVLKVTPYWVTEQYRRGVSVKGNSYFLANEKFSEEEEEETMEHIKDFLLCFDFTREKFGPSLPLPFHSVNDDCVTLSCVRDEQLAVLYYDNGVNVDTCAKVEIWVTTRIEPNSVSWSNFLRVEMRPFSLTGVKFNEYDGGSFFIDEQQKVAVVFDYDGYLPTMDPSPARYHTAFILGEDGCFKSLCLGESPNLGKRCPRTGYVPDIRIPARLCSSSYRPSLAQVQVNNKPSRKRKERHV